MMIRLRRFFLPLPLPSTTASCLNSNLRTGIHLLLREKHRNSSFKNSRSSQPTVVLCILHALSRLVPYLDRRATKKKAISCASNQGSRSDCTAREFQKPVIVLQEFGSAERLSLWNVRIRVP